MEKIKSMKFLCKHEPMASHYIYRGLGEALIHLGHQFVFWDDKGKCAFDIFSEYQPDVFLGQGYNLDRATLKCLNRNPEIKVILKVGAWGEFSREVEVDKYPVLLATEEERVLVRQLKGGSPPLLFNYCHPNRANYVIGDWEQEGKVWGFLPAADTNNFFPEEINKKYKSDIIFTGGYWAYKGINLDSYIIPLCYPVGKYNIKIFGNQPWSVPQYCGFVGDGDLRGFLTNATICPNIHEPHSNKYGFDVLNRIFNTTVCNGFCISDYVSSIEEDIFTNGEMLLAKNPQEFFDMIEHFLKNPDERLPYIEKARETTMLYHTYKNRAEDLLGMLC